MEIKEYKTEIKYIDLTILIIVLISSFIIDYLYGLNFKIIGIIALYFIVRGVDIHKKFRLIKKPDDANLRLQSVLLKIYNNIHKKQPSCNKITIFAA